MKKLPNIPILPPLLAVLLCLSSCITDPNPVPLGDGMADVRFNIDLPNQTPVHAATRADAYKDTDIFNVDLLVFDSSDMFVERVAATDLTVNVTNAATGAATCSFKARLTVSATPRTVIVVGNAHDPDPANNNADLLALDGAQVNNTISLTGKSLNDVMTHLTIKELNTTYIRENNIILPMWGKIAISKVEAQQTVNGVKLLRAFASVLVKTAAPTTANGLDKVVINGISAGNIARHTTIAPANWNSWPNSSNTIQLPTSTPYPINHFYGTNGYWTTPGSPHYVFETVYENTNQPYIIVEATYDGSDEPCYYKLVLCNPGSTGITDPIKFLRNHRYTVTIVKVRGPGYNTVTEAILGHASNDLVITFVDQYNDLTEFVADGRDYIGVSTKHVTVTRTGSETVFEICKMYSSNLQYSFTSAGLLTFTAAPHPTVDGLQILTGKYTGTTARDIPVSIYNGPGNLMIQVTVSIQD
jgi:hypothetical protein